MAASEFFVGQVSEHAIIFNEHGEVLLLRHSGAGIDAAALRGKWHFPGGRLDRDDQPGKALLREIEEETGLTDVELILPCHCSRWGLDEPVKYSVAYLARTKGRPQPVLPEHEHHMEARWVPWREALELTFIHPTQVEVLAGVADWARRLEVLRA